MDVSFKNKIRGEVGGMGRTITVGFQYGNLGTKGEINAVKYF
jgi:hypothetical protein